MRRRNTLCILPLAVVLTGSVAGCAALEEARRCGYNGCPADARITAEIEAQFSRRTELQPPNLVYVQTLKGVVYLSGLVSTDVQRQTAVQLSRRVSGVSRVVNNIALPYRDY